MTDQSSHQAISMDKVLFGASPDERIVAVEVDPVNGVHLFRRISSSVESSRQPFQPWILVSERPEQSAPGETISELRGTGLRFLIEYATQGQCREAVFRLRDQHAAIVSYQGAKSALIRSGQTLFKGMRFDEIVRMQFDIETRGLDPRPEQNCVFLIAVSDTSGMVELIEGDEKAILERFVTLVRDRDPDVLEGHNLFGFDLPFIMERARRHGVKLAIGRNGSEPTVGRERNYAIGGASRPFVPVAVYGRHVLDTYLIVQRYDWARGSLTSYGLKECARQFGIAHDDRVELPGAEIADIYLRDPEKVREYARQDVVETRRLADLITPVEFYQTQMVPDSYGQTAVTGNGEKINSLFVRAYLNAGMAVPRPEGSQPFPGGYTEVRRTGVLERVVKADVESLYPSLMLTHGIAPMRDTLGVFLPALRGLTQRRLEAKRAAASATDAASAQYADGLQGSFKVLINSFYGYLGGPFAWNDYSAAKRVTELGRELVVGIAERMEHSGSQVIEIDTDGVYFIPPDGVIGEEAEARYVDAIGAALPKGIRLAYDGRFARMLSVKTKNYVLETYEGKRIFKGSSLRSRADERYGRRFLEEAVGLLLKGDRDGVGRLYSQTIDDILHHRIGIDDLCRRERITDKTFSSIQKRRTARVAEGVAIGDHVRVFERADGQLGLQAEYISAGDENVRHYMDKLYRFARRLEDAFGPEFNRYIREPGQFAAGGQTELDLFS